VIGGFSFEERNQRCFYIVFTHMHLCFQYCVTSVNLPTPPCYRCCVCLENEALNKNIGRWKTTLVGYHVLHLSELIWWGTKFKR